MLAVSCDSPMCDSNSQRQRDFTNCNLTSVTNKHVTFLSLNDSQISYLQAAPTLYLPNSQFRHINVVPSRLVGVPALSEMFKNSLQQCKPSYQHTCTNNSCTSRSYNIQTY